MRLDFERRRILDFTKIVPEELDELADIRNQYRDLNADEREFKTLHAILRATMAGIFKRSPKYDYTEMAERFLELQSAAQANTYLDKFFIELL